MILVKQVKEWRENEAMMQQKKMQKMKEDDMRRESDASMDDVATLKSEFKVGTSKMLSVSGALVAGFLLKDGKDITSQPLWQDNDDEDNGGKDGPLGLGGGGA